MTRSDAEGRVGPFTRAERDASARDATATASRAARSSDSDVLPSLAKDHLYDVLAAAGMEVLSTPAYSFSTINISRDDWSVLVVITYLIVCLYSRPKGSQKKGTEDVCRAINLDEFAKVAV